MKVYTEEVFVSVVCIEKYNRDIQDVITKVNDSKYMDCKVVFLQMI